MYLDLIDFFKTSKTLHRVGKCVREHTLRHVTFRSDNPQPTFHFEDGYMATARELLNTGYYTEDYNIEQAAKYIREGTSLRTRDGNEAVILYHEPLFEDYPYCGRIKQDKGWGNISWTLDGKMLVDNPTCSADLVGLYDCTQTNSPALRKLLLDGYVWAKDDKRYIRDIVLGSGEWKIKLHGHARLLTPEDIDREFSPTSNSHKKLQWLLDKEELSDAGVMIIKNLQRRV